MTAATQPTNAADSIPARAQVVTIGGGVIGCSVAYHLAKRGLASLHPMYDPRGEKTPS